jgi:hypothetical protein
VSRAELCVRTQSGSYGRWGTVDEQSEVSGDISRMILSRLLEVFKNYAKHKFFSILTESYIKQSVRVVVPDLPNYLRSQCSTSELLRSAVALNIWNTESTYQSGLKKPAEKNAASIRSTSTARSTTSLLRLGLPKRREKKAEVSKWVETPEEKVERKRVEALARLAWTVTR